MYSSLVGKQTQAAYIGFDPTAQSLHIGNLLSLMSLLHFQRGGLKPIIVLGGATGLIGDPSGRSTERTMMTRETVEDNIRMFKENFNSLLYNIYKEEHTAEYFSSLKKSPEELMSDITFVNNIDIYSNMSIIDFIRDIGIHFRMSTLLSRDSVQNRLRSTDGMTFTEFSYQLFQGYDYAYLHEKYKCNYQLGGSDQWGNIASGIEYIRKTTGKEVYGATVNLLTNSQGEKLGKSAGNGLMLNPEVNSPYNFYQFFINVADDTLENLFKYLTFMPLDKIDHLMEEHKRKSTEIIPGSDNKVEDERYAHKILAKTITNMVHGSVSVMAIEATNAYFDPELRNIAAWSLDRIESHFSAVEKSQISRAKADTVSSLISEVFGKSKTEVRKLMKQGGVSLNSEKISNDRPLEDPDILHGKYALIKIGKKHFSIAQIN